MCGNILLNSLTKRGRIMNSAIKTTLKTIIISVLSLLLFASCTVNGNDMVDNTTDNITKEQISEQSAEQNTTKSEETTALETENENNEESESISESESVTEEITEAETIYAGMNAPARDGTPKKYFTLSFDDGITQDLKIIEIMKKYDVDCITFNINTGLYGANWDWVGNALGSPSTTHLRFTKEELMSGIYEGYDVEVHTLTHPSLKNYDGERKVRQLKKEIQNDADNIYEITGIYPVGMAWPGGDTEYTETTISNVYKYTTIRFARATTSSYNFELPEYFLQWKPTCGISDPMLFTLAQQFIDTPCEEDMLFYVWGHGYEFDVFNNYDVLDTLVKMMSESEDIVLVTNAEFYQLFKDEIPSWKD